MKTKKHIFRLFIAMGTFLFSIGIYTGWHYFQSKLNAQGQSNSASEPVAASSQSRAGIAEQNKESESKFDADGYYYIDGEPPKGFEDIDNVSIFTVDYEVHSNPHSVREIPIPPKGYIWTSQRYKMTHLNIGNGQISFQTEMVKGISYQFTGRFLFDSSFYDLPQDAVVLEGHLIKTHKGRRKVESNVRFTWFGGD